MFFQRVVTPSSGFGSRLLRGAALTAVLLGTAACQSNPMTRSGYLSTYEGLPQPERPLKGAAHQRRDDSGSDAVQQVFLAPAVIAPEIETELSAEEKAMVLHEVDRQLCFEVSKRFAIAPEPSPAAGTIRTAITRLQSNSRVGSAAAAAVDFMIPIPFVNLRLPSTTGGLAIESELLTPAGNQVAAIAWTRNARMVGRIKPSLSRAGDALQLAEPFGDAAVKAFATKDRPKIEIAKPDPCARFGSRQNIARSLGSGVVGAGTGLYMPQLAGTSVKAEEKRD
jgi:hypothetical protein